jgi:putative YhdH/YhfP family quinone oxidoreductase
MKSFRALVAERESERGQVNLSIREMKESELPDGEVTIRVEYSSINYKDGLAVIPGGKVVKRYPIIPGIDLAGTVAASRDSRFREGDKVIVTGYELGVSHHGGYSEYARVPGDWVVPLPDGLSLKEAMALGTAGLTAALSIDRLQQLGLSPDKGPVLVTGATGGVGSLAVSMLARLGYEVEASTGNPEGEDALRRLGASRVLPRLDPMPDTVRPLDKQKWAGAVDPVGGPALGRILSSIRYGGAVAVSGMAGGTEWQASVFPFILRGVQLLGIDSAYCPHALRTQLWRRMAGEWKPLRLGELCRETTLAELPEVLSRFLAGRHWGRTVVRLQSAESAGASLG